MMMMMMVMMTTTTTTTTTEKQFMQLQDIFSDLLKLLKRNTIYPLLDRPLTST